MCKAWKSNVFKSLHNVIISCKAPEDMQCLKSTLCLLAGVSWSCLMCMQSFYIRTVDLLDSAFPFLHGSIRMVEWWRLWDIFVIWMN